MKFIVDRIEERIAVLEKEDMTRISISAEMLPQGVKAGCILAFDGVNYIIDTQATTERKKAMLEKQNLLFKRSKKD